jgi:hypothetical protein
MELRAELPERKVELRGEDEHGQCRLQSDAAADEPHPDGDCDERDAERRRQLEHRSGEEADPQSGDRRPPIAVADLGEHGRPRSRCG